MAQIEPATWGSSAMVRMKTPVVQLVQLIARKNPSFTAYHTATSCPALLKSPFITKHNGLEEVTFRYLRSCGNGAPGSPEVKGELAEQDPSVRLMVFTVLSADSLVRCGSGGGFDARSSWLFEH
jgi:hypothetical protein